MKTPTRIALLGAVVLALAACADRDEPAQEERALPVTAVASRVGTVEVTGRTVGRLEAAVAPTLSAESAGRIVEIRHDAGDRVAEGAVIARIDDTTYRSALTRLSALETQQRRTVERLTRLVANDSASQSLLDDAEAQLAALAAQRADAETALRKTRIVAPVAGTIERRMVSVGDFRGVGEPLFQLATDDRLRAVLPFPERRAAALSVGLPVRLEPQAGGAPVDARITELRPTVGQGSRAVDAIVEIDNPGGWRPGGSVTATVVFETRDGGVLVPAQSVVQRPAGSVVYVIDGERARQQTVALGIRIDGEVEILEGLARGQRVVVDGAGFLSDGARIAVRNDRG
jgi:membrane fusion protein, multidrug efflux system